MDDIEGWLGDFRDSPHERNRLFAIEALVEKMAPRLRFFILQRCPKAMVPDVFQETMKSLIEGLPRFEGTSRSAFVAWCFTIARRRLVDALKEGSRMVAVDASILADLVHTSGLEEGISKGERLDLELAMKVFRGLDGKCQELLWERYVNDLDYAAIGEMMAMTAEAARKASGRCMEAARASIKRKERAS